MRTSQKRAPEEDKKPSKKNTKTQNNKKLKQTVQPKAKNKRKNSLFCVKPKDIKDGLVQRKPHNH
jgi:hypothetical protein